MKLTDKQLAHLISELDSTLNEDNQCAETIELIKIFSLELDKRKQSTIISRTYL